MKPNKYLYHALQQPHILIAGATGSGKSVTIHNLIYIIRHIQGAKMILIDTKKVELYEYKNLYNTMLYTDSIAGTVQALKKIIDIMDSRFVYLRRAGLKKLESDPVYIIIDEYADLVLSGNKELTQMIIKISQLGRAANIHLIVATQRPTADVINKKISVNLTARLCLRVACAVDSRNVIGCKGGEALPSFGRAIYWNEGYTYTIDLPPPPPELPHTNAKKDYKNFSIIILVIVTIILIMLLV